MTAADNNQPDQQTSPKSSQQSGQRSGIAGLFTIFGQAILGFIRNGDALIAGHLAFMGLLTLFPFLIFLVALAGFAGNTEAGTMVVAYILENMPEDVAIVFEGPLLEVLQEVRGGLLTLGVAGALWTASSALEGARAGVERAFGHTLLIPFWRRRLESLALVVVGAALILTVSTALLFAPVLWQDAARSMGFEGMSVLQFGSTRGLISISSVYLVLCGLYAMLPARRPGWLAILPGALMTLVLWGGAALCFTLYLGHFNNYDVTYGSLGGIVIAMLFFYLLGAIFLFGAEFNAAIHNSAKPKADDASK
jgi:membrane protein